MNKKLLIIAGLLLFPLVLTANFIGLNNGSKSMAMGGAYTALVNDPIAIFMNPAGLANLEYPGIDIYKHERDLRHWILANLDYYECVLSHQNMYGIDDLYNEMASITFPLYSLRGGIGWRQVNLLDNYYEQMITFSAAYPIHFQEKKQLRIGFSLKNMTAVVTKNIEGASNPSTDFLGMEIPGKFAADLGLQYQPDKRFSFGFMIENIFQPKFEFVSVSDKVKRNMRLGATYNWKNNANFVLDYEWNSDSSNWHAGGELWFFDVFAPRIGMNGEDLTVGFGIKTDRWIFNGAVLTNKNLGSTYRLSLGLIFEK